MTKNRLGGLIKRKEEGGTKFASGGKKMNVWPLKTCAVISSLQMPLLPILYSAHIGTLTNDPGGDIRYLHSKQNFPKGAVPT